MSNPNPWSLADRPGAELIVITRHRVPANDRGSFLERAQVAVATLADQPGCIWSCIAQSTDDADEFVIQTRWPDVGTYRRALSAYDVKVHTIPLLSTAVDETSAYEVIVSRASGEQTFVRSGLADDARAVGLGEAAAPSVRSATP